MEYAEKGRGEIKNTKTGRENKEQQPRLDRKELGLRETQRERGPGKEAVVKGSI